VIAVADVGRAVTFDGPPPPLREPVADEAGAAGEDGGVPVPCGVAGWSEELCWEAGLAVGDTAAACVDVLASGEPSVDASIRPAGGPGSTNVATISATNPMSAASTSGQSERDSRPSGALPTKPIRSSSRCVRAIWNRRINPKNMRTPMGTTISASIPRSAQTMTLTWKKGTPQNRCLAGVQKGE
jgi:hypothetical protein